MSDLDNHDRCFVVIDRIQHAVVALPQAVFLRPDSFSVPGGRGSEAKRWGLAAMRLRSFAGRASSSLAADGLISSL